MNDAASPADRQGTLSATGPAEACPLCVGRKTPTRKGPVKEPPPTREVPIDDPTGSGEPPREPPPGEDHPPVKEPPNIERDRRRRRKRLWPGRGA